MSPFLPFSNGGPLLYSFTMKDHMKANHRNQARWGAYRMKGTPDNVQNHGNGM